MALFTDMGLESTPVQALINRLYLHRLAMFYSHKPQHTRPRRQDMQQQSLHYQCSQISSLFKQIQLIQ